MTRFLRRLNANQSGAIAMATLAAVLIVMMLAWVMWDAQKSGRDRLDVQASADVASWSQSAVEARSMNMLAFANIAKRITFGMTSYYQALWEAYTEFVIIVAVLLVLCIIADIFGACPVVDQLAEILENTIELMVKEAPDLVTVESDLNSNYYKKDMEALDKYQVYISKLTPYWSWAESAVRGMRNGSLITTSFPVPKKLTSGGGLLPTTDKVDELPVERMSQLEGYTNMCTRIYSSFDVLKMFAEYELKCQIEGTCTTAKKEIIFAITGAMAMTPPNMATGCAIEIGRAHV